MAAERPGPIGTPGSPVLAGQVALVTGASRGIGRAIALALAQQGALVAVHYGHAADEAQATVAAIVRGGGSAFALGADLAEESAIGRLFDELDAKLRTLGHAQLDILVNNAGIGSGKSLEQASGAHLDAVFGVNVKGTFLVTQRAAPRLRDGGRIVNVSSVVSVAAYPGTIAYAMSKAAVNSMTRSLAVEMGPRQITVNAVAPGATETDFLAGLMAKPELVAAYEKKAALGRLGQPQDIAGVVAFLASPAGGWITGQVIQASGGMHL